MEPGQFPLEIRISHLPDSAFADDFAVRNAWLEHDAEQKKQSEALAPVAGGQYRNRNRDQYFQHENIDSDSNTDSSLKTYTNK